jgi:hypothetical protein
VKGKKLDRAVRRGSHLPQDEAADWLELSALRSPDGRIGFSTLVSATDLSSEEPPADIAEEDAWQEILILSAQD